MKGGEKKKMNKKSILLGATTLVLGGLILAPKISAYKGDPGVQGPNCTPERHEEMIKAFESRDYNIWKDLMKGKGKVAQVINEDNFARFAEAHQLTQEGKADEAKEIRAELGLGLKNGSGKGQGQGYGRNQ
jgi:hypothetical protein